MLVSCRCDGGYQITVSSATGVADHGLKVAPWYVPEAMQYSAADQRTVRIAMHPSSPPPSPQRSTHFIPEDILGSRRALWAYYFLDISSAVELVSRGVNFYIISPDTLEVATLENGSPITLMLVATIYGYPVNPASVLGDNLVAAGDYMYNDTGAIIMRDDTWVNHHGSGSVTLYAYVPYARGKDIHFENDYDIVDILPSVPGDVIGVMKLSAQHHASTAIGTLQETRGPVPGGITMFVGDKVYTIR